MQSTDTSSNALVWVIVAFIILIIIIMLLLCWWKSRGRGIAVSTGLPSAFRDPGSPAFRDPNIDPYLPSGSEPFPENYSAQEAQFVTQRMRQQEEQRTYEELAEQERKQQLEDAQMQREQELEAEQMQEERMQQEQDALEAERMKRDFGIFTSQMQQEPMQEYQPLQPFEFGTEKRARTKARERARAERDRFEEEVSTNFRNAQQTQFGVDEYDEARLQSEIDEYEQMQNAPQTQSAYDDYDEKRQVKARFLRGTKAREGVPKNFLEVDKRGRVPPPRQYPKPETNPNRFH